MEIRSSHGPVKSLKGFLLEVSMIVLGIVIALGFEQVRERWHERRVADDTRQNFRAEIKLERQALKFYLGKMAVSRAAVQQFLDAESQQGRTAAESPEFELNWQFLPTSSWETAVATQAFSYMDSAEIQRYTLVHTSQLIFNTFEEKYHHVLMELSAYRDRTDLTRDEQVARDRDFRIVLAYLNSIDQSGQELLRHFDEVSQHSGD